PAVRLVSTRRLSIYQRRFYIFRPPPPADKPLMAPSQPTEQTAPLATADRRRTPRRPARYTARIYTPCDQPELLGQPVTMINLSLHGAGFRAPAPLALGHHYGLEIRGDWMNLSARVRIVSCRPRNDDGFDIGAEFD